jgi:hypothetical protein
MTARDIVSAPQPGVAGLAEDRSPMALTRVLHLLRLLAERPGGMALAPLSLALQSPKTSVLSLLRGLTARGYLLRGETGYRLGPESLALGALLVSARTEKAPRRHRSSGSACFDLLQQQVLHDPLRRTGARQSQPEASSR